MNVNILTSSGIRAKNWILPKIADRVAYAGSSLGHEFICSTEVNFTADCNFYVDFQNSYHGQKTNCDIAFFTHVHEDSKEWFDNLYHVKNAHNLKGIVSMNKRYTDMLESFGVNKNKLITITPGETKNLFPLKKIKIGVVSRGGYEGYGMYFMEKLFKEYDLSNFEFNFLGRGWEHLSELAKEKNNLVNFYGDEDYSIYQKIYSYIDYLLIPGLWTAGPMSMQEALSTGTPIIASDVGFVNYEFKADYVFKPNDTEKLYSILNNLLEPRLERRKQVEHMSWVNFTKDLISFIEEVK